MGLSNAPAIFQRTMNSILAKHIQKGYCLVYLDDTVIYSKNTTDHAEHLDAVLTSLRDHNLFCQLPKCVWLLQCPGFGSLPRTVRDRPPQMPTLPV